MGFKVFFDANVLIPINLCNLLLNLADAELFAPVWSDDVLEEVERNLVSKIGLTTQAAHKRVDAMARAFPEASISGYSHLIASLTCDKKDRHVLAAAIQSGAAVLVTANLQDFPLSSTRHYEIEVVHPDQFLQDQLDLYPVETLEVLRTIPERNKRPPTTLLELLVALRKLVPDFAQFASNAARTPEAIGQSALFHVPETRPSDEDLFFPNGPNDLKNPKTVAYRWYNSVLGHEPPQVFDNLCLRAADFPSREQVAKLIDEHGLAEGIDYAIEDDRVAYMKLVKTDSNYLQAFRTGFYQGLALTLVKLDNQEWRVFAFGGQRPDASRIFLQTDS